MDEEFRKQLTIIEIVDSIHSARQDLEKEKIQKQETLPPKPLPLQLFQREIRQLHSKIIPKASV
jgi:hypothetical protein